MSAAKIIEKMRKHPLGWRIEDFETVATENRLQWRRPGHGSSHVIFAAPGITEIVSVPAKRPVQPVYVKKFLKLVDAARGKRDESPNKTRP